LAVSIRLRTQFIGWQAAMEGPLVGDSGDFGGASHVVDAALWLARQAARHVQAVMTGRPVCRLALICELDGGGVAVIEHQPTREPGIFSRINLSGEAWEAELLARYRPDERAWTIGAPEVFAGHERRVLEVPQPRPGALEPWAEAHVETARAFLGAIQGGARNELATLGEGVRVQAVLHAGAQAAAAGHRMDVMDVRSAAA
jgi:predicted dehydrogenase